LPLRGNPRRRVEGVNAFFSREGVKKKAGLVWLVVLWRRL